MVNVAFLTFNQHSSTQFPSKIRLERDYSFEVLQHKGFTKAKAKK
jgi:hypothetical protein